MAEYNYITSSGVIIPILLSSAQPLKMSLRRCLVRIWIFRRKPAGVLITMETENRDAIVRNNAELANQINPDLAGGVFLDAIWALMGGSAGCHPLDSDAGTVRRCAGTIIPKGAQAETLAGDTFFTTKSLIIGKTGLSAAICVQLKPVPWSVRRADDDGGQFCSRMGDGD